MTTKKYLRDQAPSGLVDEFAKAALIGMMSYEALGVDKVKENCRWAYAYAVEMVRARMEYESHISD